MFRTQELEVEGEGQKRKNQHEAAGDKKQAQQVEESTLPYHPSRIEISVRLRGGENRPDTVSVGVFVSPSACSLRPLVPT